MDFDLATFAAHLLTMQVAVQHKAEKALVHAAELIEKTAKDELGHYLEPVGPFPRWEQLAPSTLAHHAAMGVGDTPLLVTGKLRDSIEHEVTGDEAVIGTKMDIGAYQEFGTEKIPPRPFMGPAVYANQEKIEKIMAKGLVSGMIEGNAVEKII